ncbi:unnamed protein product, partial [Didymodactylos carnosus]
MRNNSKILVSVLMYKKDMSLNQQQNNTIEKILYDEQHNLIERMELPNDTAMNRALCDNIFVIFVSVLNRLPVIVCGKPGCSKTSVIKIIISISNLRGKKYNNTYFQTLLELIAVSYQGSKNCTSKSVEKVFKRAQKYSNATTQATILPVIVFDEIVLADLFIYLFSIWFSLSVYNSRKILHNELEIENCKYGFVAISNWRLDASKMNRALYLAYPGPTLNDLQLTAITIHKSMNKFGHVQLNDDVMNGLTCAYLQLCY